MGYDCPMTDEPADPASEIAQRQENLRRRAVELQQEFRNLAAQHAQIAEFSATVHDEAARVHETLAHPKLDPADLRAHADAERDVAVVERLRAHEKESDVPSD